MFLRSELKLRAKEVLKRENTYWLSVVVCLVVTGICDILSMVTTRFSIRFDAETMLFQIGDRVIDIYNLAPVVIAALALTLILQLVFSIFLFSPLAVGKYRFFIKSANGENDIGTIFDVFKGSGYINVVKIIFFKNLYIFLWSLFFVIPYVAALCLMPFFEYYYVLLILSFFGAIPVIMKSYSYFMVDYIVAENPEISKQEAFEQSIDMMRECRFKTFVLELSFFGWLFIGAMACGVGVFFVTPYIEATMAQLYINRKEAF